ncbi:MAG: hypothetical protein NC902_05240 [Candidatus Omnitrophica bacterium]|nr:hypothetical protein [Candidatus Omnitrophota bacterium]
MKNIKERIWTDEAAVYKYTSEEERMLSEAYNKVGYVKDLGATTYFSTEKKRREFGAHFTSVDIFKKFIFPEIKNILYKYSWIDLFAGEGKSLH